jgi:hypothetical protein
MEENRLRVFQKRVLGSIFGPKRDEAIGSCRKVHNEELYSLYSSPSIIRMIKSRRIRQTGRHISCMGAKEKAYHIERHHYEEKDVDGDG